MPALNLGADDYFMRLLAQITQRLRHLETQQNWGVADTRGRQRVRGGLQPDGTFGVWFLDPTTGDPVAKMTGTKVEFLTAAGAVVLDLTDTGLTVYNATGVEEVQLGAIGSGDYGLTVRNPAGAMQVVAGKAVDAATAQLTCSSTSYAALSGGPSVTVTAPPSGSADLTLGAIVTPGSYAAGESTYLAVSLTGSTTPYRPVILVSAPANDALPQTAFAEARVTGLTPGRTYTFGVLAKVTTPGVVAKFTQTTITATPI